MAYQEQTHHLGVANTDRTVDLLTALAGTLAVLAVAGWILCGFIAYSTRDNTNAVALTMAIGPTITLSVSSTLLAVGSIIRKYVRCKVEHAVRLVTHRMDTVAATYSARASVPATNGAPATQGIGETLQAYIAGKLDRDLDD